MRTIFLIMIGLSSLIYAEFSRENGVVTDSNTKLEWQDDYSDNEGNIKFDTWSNAIDYCEALSLNGQDWRLPNINELKSLVDNSRSFPSIDPVFENTYSSYFYWSSTSYVNGSEWAWIVEFGSSIQNRYSKIFSNNIRCVRNGK